MERSEIIGWLLEGDVAIQYQTHRDLLKSDPPVLSALKERIPTEGWGKDFLKRQHPDGYWGRGFYQPKWTSSHYTLLDLRYLCLPATPGIRKALDVIIATCIGADGGINPSGTVGQSDVCINGMFLNYSCYFGIEEAVIKRVVDFIISQQMADGGYNCRLNRSGANHSSLHTTLCVLEGLREYVNKGYGYKKAELQKIEGDCQKFLLQHNLYRSDRTGEIIHPGMLKLVYPPRWKYDILRALDYLCSAQVPYDGRMQDALEVIIAKRTKAGLWKTQAGHRGVVHFTMEPAGKSSRWNTLRAMRVLEYFLPERFGTLYY